jgi:hypothetical protein
VFNQLRRVLVESFVGAIALGWLLAQGLMHFVDVFAAPIGTWVARAEYREFANHPSVSTAFTFQSALPELAKSAALLSLCYALLRWLYFNPPARPKSVPDSESPA